MQLVLVVAVYIHPSPLGTDAAPLFHGYVCTRGHKRVENPYTLDTDEGSTGDRSRARRSILLVRREPPPSLTFLSLL